HAQRRHHNRRSSVQPPSVCRWRDDGAGSLSGTVGALSRRSGAVWGARAVCVGEGGGRGLASVHRARACTRHAPPRGNTACARPVSWDAWSPRLSPASSDRSRETRRGRRDVPCGASFHRTCRRTSRLGGLSLDDPFGAGDGPGRAPERARAAREPGACGVRRGGRLDGCSFRIRHGAKLAFVLIATVIAFKLLFGRDSWQLADDLPGALGMALYGAFVGLAASLMGISGGSISNMILTLHGKSIHKAVATSAGLGVPITIAGTIGYMLAGLPQQPLLPPLSIGFVS